MKRISEWFWVILWISLVLGGIVCLFGGGLVGLAYCITKVLDMFRGTEPVTFSGVFWIIFVNAGRGVIGFIGAAVCWILAFIIYEYKS